MQTCKIFKLNFEKCKACKSELNVEFPNCCNSQQIHWSAKKNFFSSPDIISGDSYVKLSPESEYDLHFPPSRTTFGGQPPLFTY